MMHYLLSYEIAADYFNRREVYRREHLQLAWAAADRGELVLGGVVGEPGESSLLLFWGDSPEVAIRFAEADPYVQHGLVAGWTVKPWLTVAGANCAKPIRYANE
ncbi:MAG: YciI family protein [Planctomycetaceae bacterium]|nr:YciI family protein [Planctomycetaceae bacterium]